MEKRESERAISQINTQNPAHKVLKQALKEWRTDDKVTTSGQSPPVKDPDHYKKAQQEVVQRFQLEFLPSQLPATTSHSTYPKDVVSENSFTGSANKNEKGDQGVLRRARMSKAIE